MLTRRAAALSQARAFVIFNGPDEVQGRAIFLL